MAQVVYLICFVFRTSMAPPICARCGSLQLSCLGSALQTTWSGEEGIQWGWENNLAYWRLRRSCHGVVEAILHPIRSCLRCVCLAASGCGPGPRLGHGAWGGCAWLAAFVLLAWGWVLVACSRRLGLGCLWYLELCCTHAPARTSTHTYAYMSGRACECESCRA